MEKETLQLVLRCRKGNNNYFLKALKQWLKSGYLHVIVIQSHTNYRGKHVLWMNNLDIELSWIKTCHVSFVYYNFRARAGDFAFFWLNTLRRTCLYGWCHEGCGDNHLKRWTWQWHLMMTKWWQIFMAPFTILWKGIPRKIINAEISPCWQESVDIIIETQHACFGKPITTRLSKNKLLKLMQCYRSAVLQ